MLREIVNYKLDILGVSKVRWTGVDKIFIKEEKTHITYSCRNDDQHSEGVAIVMSKEAEKSLTQWEPISERLITARFQTRFVKVTIIQCYAPTVTIIQCYAPTNDHNDEDKDKFYNQLQSLINKTPSHHLLLVMGDFNAKIGNDNTSVERTIGTHGIGQLNQNGKRLLELCEVSDICISNTTFQNKDIHKVTWNSPDDRTKNQIDHISINKKY